MKKNTRSITAGFLLAAVSLLGLSAFTGCESFDNFKQEYPVTSNLAKSGLFIGLNALAGENETIFQNRDALALAINTAFAESRSPDDAASILDAQTSEILEDADVRASLIAAWQAQLDQLATTPEGTPAAGPQHTYCSQLSAALGDGTPTAAQ